jgi:hypothetical protein
MQHFDLSMIFGLIYPLLILFAYYLGRYIVLESLLNKFRICIDSVDDALKDNNVSEEEFKKIWDDCYIQLIASLPTKTPPSLP